MFLGLESQPNAVVDSGNTSRFVSVDETASSTSLFEIPFVFPWSSNEPNDLGGEEDCVV